MKALGYPLEGAYLRSSTPNSPLILTPLKISKVHLKSYSETASKSSSSVSVSSIIAGQTLKRRAHRSKYPIKPPLISSEEDTASKSQINELSLGSSNLVVMGAVTLGIALFLMGFDDQKALAFGPEGPLVEEFWDNMRRYALYALTVSTGFAYALFQPILELLKNPISAILILTIIGGCIYIVSQVVSAMVGISDFSYDYSY